MLQAGQIKINFGNEDLKKQNNIKENNKISTTKYNLLTWLPKSLVMQFASIPNIYFLIISILTCMSFSPKNPVTMIGTFAIVLIFTMLKEGYEVTVAS
jgi:phospholipid-translocating ATPase